MDAIVLAGGRGKRMGALTLHRQKGSLGFLGKPIVNHVVRGVLQQKGVSRVIVAGGYRSDDVRNAIRAEFRELVRDGSVKFMDLPVTGNLVRLANVIREAGVQKECFSCGIDVLVPPEVLSRLFEYTKMLGSPEVVMPVSSLTHIAPSHPRVQVRDGIVASYCPKPLETPPSGEGWQSSLGMRYISGPAFHEIASFNGHNVGFLSIAKQWQENGKKIHAYSFREPWQHFGVPADFRRVA